jgi:hypothetical protein
MSLGNLLIGLRLLSPQPSASGTYDEEEYGDEEEDELDDEVRFSYPFYSRIGAADLFFLLPTGFICNLW